MVDMLKDKNVDLYHTEPKWLRPVGKVVEHATNNLKIGGSEFREREHAEKRFLSDFESEPNEPRTLCYKTFHSELECLCLASPFRLV
jgi:hypothetical protein